MVNLTMHFLASTSMVTSCIVGVIWIWGFRIQRILLYLGFKLGKAINGEEHWIT
jgi:hypothetical protein